MNRAEMRRIHPLVSCFAKLQEMYKLAGTLRYPTFLANNLLIPNGHLLDLPVLQRL